MKKRIFAALGALLLLLMLTACAGQTAVNAAQSLRPAEMTEEENAVLTLLGGSQTSSALSAPTAIVTDQEIPLMIQILDSGDKTVSYSPEYFFHPEEYEKLGCERVYAVTVTFSSDSLS